MPYFRAIMEKSDRALLIRLAVTGLLVVLGSVVTALAMTHFSFTATGTLDYRTAMIWSAIIPLCVAPPAYLYIARLSWKLQHMVRALDDLARHDPLTGLFNRRAFVERAEAALAAGPAPLLIMADIDHFKRINDRYGHGTGDLALRHVAKLLDGLSPSGSIVARIGGEEFAILIPAASLGGVEGQTLVASVCEGLRGVPVITPGGMTRMTASFGFATARAGETLDALLSRADKALYQAKSDGRDRIAQAG